VSGAGQGHLAGRLIALGVTGSIAAYKAVELLRRLAAEGADVVVLLSPAASRFVGPLTFAALSRHPVETDVLALLPDGRIGHIVVGDSADAIVVAPATAHFLGAMASGLPGDVVTAACLATSAPVVVAPAMDGDMWRHPATQANVARLRDAFGYSIVEPESGRLASGQSGVGRLAELDQIVDAVVAAVADRPVRASDPAARPPLLDGAVRDADLVGRRIVVTAGGTREQIDPVRFIGNRSPGEIGVALAEAARDRGADVVLIAGSVEVDLPSGDGVDVVRIESTGNLRAALGRAMLGGSRGGDRPADALVMAAAVADFSTARISPVKVSRAEGLTLQLESTPDLLAEIGRIVRGTDSAGAATRASVEPRPILVGFAAETQDVVSRASAKRERKHADFIVANDVSRADAGFDVDTNAVTIVGPDGAESLPLQSKSRVAAEILDRVERLLAARPAGNVRR